MFLNLFPKKSSNTLSSIQPLTVDELLQLLASRTFQKAQQKLGEKIQIVGQPDHQGNTGKLLKYVENLYQLLSQTLGPEIARSTFEAELETFKKEYGLTDNYFQLLKILPIPVMHSEKLAVLSRVQLEEELKLKINQLEDIKSSLEDKVLQRTQVIIAERNKLSVTLASISDAVIALDLDRKIILFNKAAESLTDYRQEDLLGQPIDRFIKLYDNKNELGPLIYSPMENNQFEGVVFSRNNLKMIGGNNKQAYINLISARIKEGSLTNIGCILTLHDVTRERQLEEMKLDFVSMAVHELRTPLTSLKGYLHIFLRNYRQSLSEAQVTILTRVNIATQRLVTLVENLLNVSRIERGAITLNPQSFDWVKNIEDLVAEVIDQAREKKIKLIFLKPKGSFIQAHVDKLRINEVLMNLLSNAINYTPTGGRIMVWTEIVGDEVLTHIQDTGAGIPKEALPHLFTKFFRISGELEQGSKGTGLGLYIAKSIVSLHKGRIWAESQPGKGSTFTFSFPHSKFAHGKSLANLSLKMDPNTLVLD